MKNLPLDWFDAVSSWARREKPASGLKVERDPFNGLIEPLEARIAPATATFDSGTGILTISGDATGETVTISVNGAGTDLIVGGVTGYTGQPLTGLNGIIFDGNDGDDTFSVDFTTGLIGKPITFNGGNGIDRLLITGDGQGNVTHTFDSATSGSITTGLGSVTYTGLESSQNVGTSAKVTLQLKAGANSATLGDNGVSGDFISRLGVGAFAADFRDPSGTVAIESAANAVGTLTVQSPEDLKAELLLGKFGGRFSTINLNGTVSLGTGKTLRADANTINVAGALTTTGAGKVHFEAETVLGAGSISTGGGIEVMVTENASVLSGAIGGSGGLTKFGNGTLALSGVNTYGGATDVLQGKLVVASTGSIAAASTVTVANSATLGGTGTINGSVTIQAGGILAPGVNGTGTLTTGNLTFNANSILAAEINGAADFDRVLTNGNVMVDPAANAVLTGTYSPVNGNQFRLIDATGNLTGNFNGITHNGQVFFNNAPLKAAYSFGNGIFELYYDTAPVLDGTSGNDSFSVSLNAAGNVVVTRGGTTVLNTPRSSLTQLTINGGDGNDTLTVNYLGGGGFFNLPIVFNGGTQTPGGQDTLVLSGAPISINSVHYQFTNENDGTINIDGALITYTGLEPIIDGVSATNRTFTFNGGSETISLIDAGGGEMTIDSTLGESVTFVNPLSSLSINAGTGDDIITIGSLGVYQGALTVGGSTGNNSISFDGAVTLSALTLTSATITQSAALTVLGNTSINVGNLAVTLSNAGNDFQGSVTVQGGAITLSDTNALTISSISASGDVIVTADDNLSVGTITAPVITLTSNDGAIVDSNGGAVNVTGGNLVLNAQTGISLDTAVARVDAENQGSGDINLRDADTLTVGLVRTLGGNGNILISNASSNISVIGNVTANGSGTVWINSAGRITVSAVNLISSVSGDIALDATLNIQMFGSVSTAGNVRLDADSNNNNSGSITTSTMSLVTANTLTLRSAEGIDLRTNANTIDFDNSFTGNVTIRENNGASVFGVNLGDDVVLDTPTGNWQLGAISAPGSTVVVRTQGGSILDNNGGTDNITALAAILHGTGGVGTSVDPIDTNIDQLEGFGGDGGIFIRETNGLQIGGITVPAGALPGDVDGLSANGGNIQIVQLTSGTLTIVEQISTPGNVLLTAIGAITESGSGRIAAALLQTNSEGAQTLTGANAVRQFDAENSGGIAGIVLYNNSLAAPAPGDLTISQISNQTGGVVTVQNTGNVTITGSVTSGNSPTPLGGSITISSTGLLNVAAGSLVSSRGGAGGTLTLANNVTIDGTVEVGYGHVSLVGGAGDLNINSPISVQTNLALAATGNINIAAKVETTLTTSNLTLTADTDLDSNGGIRVYPGGELKAGADLTLIGSNYIGTTQSDSIIIEADTNGAAQLAAFGNIRLLNGPAAPLEAATYLAGYVNAITTGNVTFEHAVQLTADTARVATRGAGNILFNGTLDGGFNLRLSTDVGVITFDEKVGETERVGAVRIDSALDVTIAEAFNAASLTITNAPGTVAIAGPVSTTATGNNFVVNANILNVGGAVSAGAGNIVWSVDNLAIEAPVSGTGTLTIQPLTANRSIGLNGAGDLNLTTDELDLLVDGFAGIQIGAAAGKSAITVGAVTFKDSVTILSPAVGGTINVLGTVTATGTAGVTLQAPTIALNVSGTVIDTAGGAVTLTGGVLLGADTTIETVGVTDGGAFTQNGTINGAYNLVVATGSGAIDLNGSNSAGGPGIGNSQPLKSVTFDGSTVNVRTQIVTTGAQTYKETTNLLSGSIKTTGQAGTVVFLGNVNVAPAFSMTTSNGSIVFFGGIDAIGAGGEIRLNAPGGQLSFNGPLGGTTPLKSLTIQNAASATFGSTVNVNGNISIAADEIDFADTVRGTGSLELKPASTNVATHVGGTVEQTGILDLTAADIAALANGFTCITIGRDLGEAGVRIAGPVVFQDPVIFEQSGRAGTIDVAANVSGTGNASIDFRSTLLRFTSPDPVTISTQGQAVTFDGVVSFEGSPSVSINTADGSVLFKAAVRQGSLYAGPAPATPRGTNLTIDAAGGDITFAKTIGARTGATVGAIELYSNGITTLNGAIYAESIGVNRGVSGGPIGRTDLLAKSITTHGPAGQEFNTDLLLNSSIRFNPLQGDIAVRGDVTSKVGKTYSISATAAMGDILFEGNIGTANGSLGNIRAKTKTGDATFSGAIFAKGVAIVANTLSVDDVTTSITQSYTGAATFTGALTGTLASSKLKINSTIDIISDSDWKITGRVVLKAKGGSELKKIELTGANEFGEIDILAAMNATIHEDVGNLVIRTANVTGTLTLDAVNNIEDGKRIRVGTLIASSGGSIVLDAQNRISTLGAIAAESGVTILSGGTHVTLTGLISTETGNVIIVGNDRSWHNVLAGAGAEIDLGTGGGYYRIYTHDSAIGNLLTLNPALVETLGNRYPYELMGSDNAIIASRIA